MTTKILVKSGQLSNFGAQSFDERELVYAYDQQQLFIHRNGIDELVSNLSIGPLANRLPAGIKNRMYYATDTKELYLDDGAAWILLNKSTSTTVGSLWFPDLQADSNYGHYHVHSISGHSPFTLSFYLPKNFSSIDSMGLSLITSQNISDTGLTVSTNYAKVGEDYQLNAHDYTNIAYSFNANIISYLDVSSYFPGITAESLGGITLEFNKNKQFYILGMILRYNTTGTI